MQHGQNYLNIEKEFELWVEKKRTHDSEIDIFDNHAIVANEEFQLDNLSAEDRTVHNPYASMFANLGVEPFAGYGRNPQDLTSLNKTWQLMERLALRMFQNPDSRERTNPAIPAGYTYLAQFVTHDITFSKNSNATFPADPVEPSGLINLRRAPLQLDVLYGDGPDHAPWLYEPEATGPRYLLKLGRDEDGNPTFDIPRCPHHPTARKADEHSGPPTPFDPLIADVRNEDNLILSQIAALFALLHNHIARGIRSHEISTLGASAINTESIYDRSRRVTVAIYNNVVKHDLLGKLLHPDVYSDYVSKSKLEDFEHLSSVHHAEQPPIPIEFSSAALRIGHAMVRSTYKINDALSLNLRLLLFDYTAVGRATPLPPEHAIDWRLFFHVDPAVVPNASRRLSASVTGWLHQGSEFGTDKGGLIYRDLARSFLHGITSGQQLAKALTSNSSDRLSPDEIRCNLANNEFATQLFGPHLSSDDIDVLSNDTPLLYYILLEADKKMNGEKLGIVGSTIIAESVFYFSIISNKKFDIKIDEFYNLFDIKKIKSIKDIFNELGIIEFVGM